MAITIQDQYFLEWDIYYEITSHPYIMQERQEASKSDWKPMSHHKNVIEQNKLALPWFFQEREKKKKY